MAQRASIEKYGDGSVTLTNMRNNLGVPVFGMNETISATMVDQYWDGSPMDDSKVDGKLYLKLKKLPAGADSSMQQYVGKYFRVNLPNWGELFLEKDTMAEMRGLSSIEILLLKASYYKGVRLNGYYVKNDIPSPIEYVLSETSDADDGGSVITVGDIKLEHDFGLIYNVLYFGAKGDDVFDNTEVILRLKNKLASKPSLTRGTIYFPKGRYKYTDLGRTAYENLKWEGENMDNTVLISTEGDIAFNQDADFGVLPSETRPFVNNSDVQNLTISGHAGTKIIWKQNLTSRGKYININLINASPTEGVGLQTSNMLGYYESIYCSTNKNVMSSKPLLGLRLVEGFRVDAGVTKSIGRSTNNTFQHCYWEGTPRGVYIKEGDTNFFVGGSPEANTEYSLYIEENNKGNTFIGVGFESNLAPYDVYDDGWFTQYIGCYSSNKFIFGKKSRGVTWENGTLQSVELQFDGTNRAWWPRIEQSHWNHDTARTPSATFVDQGAIRPTFINVYNRANGAFQKGYDEINQENYYGTRYLNLTLATGDTRAGNFQEYIESNFAGNQTITFKSGTEYSIGVTKRIRKNTATGVTTITPESGVTFNSTTAPVTLNALNEQVVFFCVGLNSWRYYKIPANNATTSVYGVVRQSSHIPTVTVADTVVTTNPVAVVDSSSSATDVAGLVADFNDLVSKYNVAVALLNELKSKYDLMVPLVNKNKETINTEITTDRTSGQRASS